MLEVQYKIKELLRAKELVAISKVVIRLGSNVSRVLFKNGRLSLFNVYTQYLAHTHKN